MNAIQRLINPNFRAEPGSEATGRRKRSIARVFLTPGKGSILINGQPFKDYLCRDTLATIVMQPLVAVENEKSYNINPYSLYLNST